MDHVVSPALHFFLSAARKCISENRRDRLLTWIGSIAVKGRKPFQTPENRKGGPESHAPAMNLFGYLTGEMGVGEGARSTIRAAQAASVELRAIDLSQWCRSRSNEPLHISASNNHAAGINLFHVNADQMPLLALWTSLSVFDGRHNIGYWLWETDEFPDAWLASFNFVDEIWTASSFCRDVIARKTNLPVTVIPCNVEPMLPADGSGLELDLPQDNFTFLCMADFLSTPERKNILGAVEAFLMAFGKYTEGVCLVVKIINSESRPDVMSLLNDTARSNPNIILIPHYLSRPEVNVLLSSIDCYVSLHRSEGFGLPIAEAMYFGKPVVATGWSGNMDFMNEDNSFPVPFTMVDIDKTCRPYHLGGRWAEPDLEHAAETMKKLAADPALCRAKGQLGRQTILDRFSPKATGMLIRQQLRKIMGAYDWGRADRKH